MKKTILAAAIASTMVSSMALASVDDYEMRVTTNVENGDWSSVAVIYTEWENSGNHYDCNAWSPEPTDVDFGQSYLQSRTCKQDQEREAIFKEEHTATGEIKEVRRVTEYQTIGEDESQVATGTKQNWEPMTGSASSWDDTGSPYNHSSWSPEASTQTSNFTQSRSYSQDQTRTVQSREYDSVTGEIRNVGSPVTETRTVTLSENRAITVSSNSWSVDWSSRNNCSSWSPSTGTVNAGVKFKQTRSCDYTESKTWYHRDKNSTLINTHKESQTTSRTSSNYSAYGTKTYCKYTGTGTWKWYVSRNSQGNDYVTITEEGIQGVGLYNGEYSRHGFRYTKGSYVETSGGWKYYKLCKGVD